MKACWPGLKIALFSLLVIVLPQSVFVSTAYAASQVDIFEFDSNEQRQRYRGLIEELRCPKCMNTNIAGSDAPIAKDLRAAVHRLLVEEGMTDEEILTFMHERYGDFVLYDPPFVPRTWLLWLLPIGVGLLVLMVLIVLYRRAQVVVSRELDDAERARIARFLEDK